MNKLSENVEGIRRCSLCKQPKELNSTNFHSDKSRYLGFMYTCRSCEKDRASAKYLKNPRLDRYKYLTESQKAGRLVWARAYAKKPKGRAIGLLSAYRQIDTSKGQTCDLTQDFIINTIFTSECTYCGDTKNLGCDRVDNTKGHILSNVVPCCGDCNIARMDNFTFDEMKTIGKAIRQVKQNRKDLPHFQV